MIKIAILASGSGTNAEALVKHFSHHSKIEVALILSNKEDAGVLERAKRLNIPAKTFSKSNLLESAFVNSLKKAAIDYIVLAGFLLKIPEGLIKAYPDKIINIHPALLPKYGGKGMYGSRVHEAVVSNKEKESGITIHLVNENYDEGRQLFQAKVILEANENANTLAQKIHALEHKHFPSVVENYILSSI